MLGMGKYHDGAHHLVLNSNFARLTFFIEAIWDEGKMAIFMLNINLFKTNYVFELFLRHSEYTSIKIIN